MTIVENDECSPHAMLVTSNVALSGLKTFEIKRTKDINDLKDEKDQKWVTQGCRISNKTDLSQ